MGTELTASNSRIDGPGLSVGCPGILLLGAASWETIPVAAISGGGQWTVANTNAGQFPGLAAQSGVRAVTGNFSGAGGPSDVALFGGQNWNTMPVALSNADGSYWTVSNQPAGGFSLWSAEPGVTVLTGDFGKTGKTAIALTGAAGWDTMPLALSNGDGTWEITNVGVAPYSNSGFPGWAAEPGVTAVAGDFSLAGTGQAAIALVGGSGWNTIPLAFALAGSNGTWMATNAPAGDFPGWAAQPGAKVVTGKFSTSGLTDIALLGVPGWTTIPVAFANANAGWTVTNSPAPQFAAWAAEPGVTVVTGRFNTDPTLGLTDIALLGVSGSDTIPIAFANGDGSWTITNQNAGDFPAWALQPGAQVVPCDFLGSDGLTAIALTGDPNWDTIPIAAPTAGGNWTVFNNTVAGFPGWAATSNVSAYPVQASSPI